MTKKLNEKTTAFKKLASLSYLSHIVWIIVRIFITDGWFIFEKNLSFFGLNNNDNTPKNVFLPE